MDLSLATRAARVSGILSILGVCVATAALADPAPTVRAGAWETTARIEELPGTQIPPNRFCRTADIGLDTILKTAAAQRAQAHCVVTEFATSGPVSTYTQVCVNGQLRTVMHGTVTIEGPDLISSTIHTNADAGAGKSRETNMTTVSRRLGPCEPGDSQP